MLNIKNIFPAASTSLIEVLESAPMDLLAVNAAINYEDALEAKDPRYVETTKARAEQFEAHFYRTFGYDNKSGRFQAPPNGKGKHVLFFGHVGCGKSTELTQLCQHLHDPLRYWVIKVDLLRLLDPSNVNYSDIWLAVAQQLVEQLERDHISVEPVALDRLKNWFTERVLSHEQIRDLSAGLTTEVEAGSGIPLIGKVLARFTAAIKTGSTHRDALRTVVRNTYGEFTDALNLLLQAAISAVSRANKGQQILIVIDGTDRFRGEDWKRFFVDEVNQLLMVSCIAVYTAPMALKSSGERLDRFDSVVLPMIKLRNFNSGVERPEAYCVMQQILLKRCYYGLFDHIDTLNVLINFSGGHLRDALRLLSYACVEADTAQLTLLVIQKAAVRLAGDYRSWLEKEHYPSLVESAKNPENDGRSDIITKLVEGGALLEYNSGSWRQPHPVTKLLHGYKQAQIEMQVKADARVKQAAQQPV